MLQLSSPLLTLCAFWLFFFIYCVLGWVMESTYCSIVERRLVNRGFLNGPYIPIYGSGAVISTVALHQVQNPLVLFVASGLMSCVLEYVTSYVVERMYHARWWDYSHLPLNLNGRIWAGGFAEFGVCCTLVVLVVNPPLMAALAALGGTLTYALAAVTFVVFMADLGITHFGITGLRAKMDALKAETYARLEQLRDAMPQRPELAAITDWDSVIFSSLRSHVRAAQQKLRNVAPDVQLPTLAGVSMPKLPGLEDFAESFTSHLNAQELRIMEAFPRLRPSEYRSFMASYSKLWAEAKDELRKLADSAQKAGRRP